MLVIANQFIASKSRDNVVANKNQFQYFYKTWSSVNNMLHVHSNTSISLINFTYTLPLAISPSVSLLGGKSVDFRSSSVLSFILNGSFLFLLRLSKTHKKHISARYLIQNIQRIKTKKFSKMNEAINQ